MGVFNTAEKNCRKKKCTGMPTRLFQSSVDRVANRSYGQWRAPVKRSTEGEAQGTLPIESHHCSGFNLTQLPPASKLAGDDHFCSGPGDKGRTKGGGRGGEWLWVR